MPSQPPQRLIFQEKLQIIFSITLVAVMGVSSITPVFPRISQVMGISNHQVGLLITMFTLPGIFLNPFLGVLADRYGRKTIVVPSLFLFAAAGVACGFTRDFGWLLVFRFFQGVGAASLGSINVTLVGDFYEGRQRATAMGANASVLSIGTAAYPAIGGALAMMGWYYPFFLPVLAVPVGLWVLLRMPSPARGSRQPFKTYLRGVAGYLKHRNVIALFMVSVFTFIILYGSYLTYLPLLLDGRFGAQAWEIGLILSIGSVTTAAVSPNLGRLAARFHYKPLLLAANTFYIVSMLLIPAIGSKWMMLIPAAIFGIAMGINIPGIQTLLAGSVPTQYRAAFMSVNGMVLRLGQTLGPVITGLVYATAGMAAAFYTGAVSAIIILLLLVVVAGKFKV
ncbi:MAG: MFS transporter [Bacteroidales bacterium]|jgi:MFS family permease|nr:MFS transporter [Bacteroidales bacterium]MDD2632440.1 MFS transporter [Bacteroidales bacterium]MDD4178255.1 MFS transporter [Bacteroidales bacterium]NCU37090.1 MFS transporter [Candidatus Falkowbacteria bacterium]